MPTLLFTVDRVSSFAGYVHSWPGAPSTVSGVSVGSVVKLHRPDGTIFQTSIDALPIVDPWFPGRPTHIAFKSISAADVPRGTEVWLQDAPEV